jgi:hypothetical protein
MPVPSLAAGIAAVETFHDLIKNGSPASRQSPPAGMGQNRYRGRSVSNRLQERIFEGVGLISRQQTLDGMRLAVAGELIESQTTARLCQVVQGVLGEPTCVCLIGSAFACWSWR